jgi:hypothetical protein
VNADGLKVVHTITPAPGAKGAMGGWVKIRTSKGKALLTLVGAKEDDANQASPATGASPTPSKQRRRGSITEMFGGGGGGGGKSESQQADSPKSQRGSKTEKEVPLQGVGQFYRVHLSRAGGVNEEELRMVIHPDMIQFYDAKAQRHSATLYHSIRSGQGNVRTCSTGFMIGLNGGANVLYSASTKDARSIVMQVQKKVEAHHAEHAPLPGGFKVGDRVDVEGEDGWELGATILGPSKGGDKSELRVKFADGVVDDWPFDDFRPAVDDASAAAGGDDSEADGHASDVIPDASEADAAFMAEFQGLGQRRYDMALEAEVRAWMSSLGVDGVDGDGGGGGADDGSSDFMSVLKSGVVLCQLANALRPGVVGKINTMSMPFMQMENISSFLTAAEALGVQASDRFQTVDLFEAKQPTQVLLCLQVLKRLHAPAAAAPAPAAAPAAAAAAPASSVQKVKGAVKGGPPPMATRGSAPSKAAAAGAGAGGSAKPTAKPTIPRGNGKGKPKGKGKGKPPPQTRKGGGKGPPPIE